MQIPSTLDRFVPQINTKLAEFDGRLTLQDVFRWALQFDQAEQALAVKLFLNLRYFTASNVAELCKLLFGHLPPQVKANLDNTLFVGIGSPSDSGTMLTYHYRVNNHLPEERFLSMDGLREQLARHGRSRNRRWNLVFIDDFIGTGGQATEMLSRELRELVTLGRCDYLGFHALVGFLEGVERIKAATSLDVQVAHVLTNRDRVFHEASEMLAKDYYVRERLKDAMLRYGKLLYPRGPLGFGDTQALVAFFYNTPNNTLPVFWAKTNGWHPLLPRLEAEVGLGASEHEKVLLTYLACIGGQSPVHEILVVEMGLDVPMEATIELLRRKHLVRIIEDDAAQYLKLTAKGDREVLDLFDVEKGQTEARLRLCGAQFRSILPSNPRSSQKSYDELRSRKREVVALVRLACEVGDVGTVKALRRTASWLLLMEHAYEERIHLAKIILGSFDRESLGAAWGWAMIDDLGWSYVAHGMLDEAKQAIEQGIERLWQLDDMLGVCQGWRHLQAIKVRKGDHNGARFGLRLVFGAACAIPDVEGRLEMQAGVLRALADACRRQGHGEAHDEYRGFSEVLSRRSAQLIHAPSDSRRISLSDVASGIAGPDGPAALLLLRHPLTAKNQKRTFGRHLQDIVPADGVAQIALVASAVRASVGARGKGDTVVYSAPAKSALLLAQRVGGECGWPVITEPALSSVDAGVLTGLSEEEAPEHFPELMAQLVEYRQKRRDGFSIEFPGGESFRTVTMRVGRLLIQGIYAEGIPETCVLVGHASSITTILNIVEALDRLPDEAPHTYYDVPVASISRIDFDAQRGGIRLGLGVSKTGTS